MAAQTSVKPLSIAFVSLGCAKNLVDSERMLAQLGQDGHIIGAPEDEAEVIVINTCGFLEEACQEAYEVIGQALARKQAGPCRHVVVTGCLASRFGRQLLEEFPDVDALVGVNNRNDLPGIVSTLGQGKPRALLSGKAKTPQRDTPRARITPASYAYLRISEGCSQNCSFCTIPAIRGVFRSKSPRTILTEARELLADGVAELDIIGQDTSSYGSDLPDSGGLANLLTKLDALDGLGWLRVLYAYPSSISNETIMAMADLEHVLSYLDLPLQHINDRILRRMGRRFSRSRTERLIEKLFSAMPELALRTTMIVGFPGESDAEFAELMDFVGRVRFHALGAFAFSPEAGTAAANFPDQIPQQVKEKRLEALMQLQQHIVIERNGRLIGRKIDVLIDSAVDSENFEGRYYAQAPEVDAIYSMRSNRPLLPGQIISAKVIGSRGYDLTVKPVDL